MNRSRLFPNCIRIGLLLLVAATGCSSGRQDSGENTQAESALQETQQTTSQASSSGDQRFVGESPLPLHQQAVFAFDLKMSELMNSDLVESFVSEEMLKLHKLIRKRDLEAFQTVRRITGCVADTDRLDLFFPRKGTSREIDRDDRTNDSYGKKATRSRERTDKVDAKEFRVPDFWCEIEFVDRNFVQTEVLSELNLDEPVELYGKSFLQSRELKALDIFVLSVDERTLQFGTRSFFQYRPANLVSQNLAKLWNQTPGDAPLRVVMDGQGAVSAASGLADFLSENAPNNLDPYIDLLRLRADIVFKVDPSDPKMVSLDVDAGTSAGANQVLAAFRNLHVWLESGAAEIINGVLKPHPEDGKVLKQLVDSLRPAVSNSTVSVRLQKPFEFEKRLRNFLARGMRNLDRRSVIHKFHSVGLAINDYRQTHRDGGPFGVKREGFHDNLSWRVVVMSGFFGNIRAQYDPSKAWDDPANRELMRSMPYDFGTGGLNTRIVHVKRGKTKVSRHAIMLMESKSPVPWSRPVDLDVQGAINAFRSRKPGESLCVMTYDRAVYDVRRKLDDAELRKLFSENLTKSELDKILLR